MILGLEPGLLWLLWGVAIEHDLVQVRLLALRRLLDTDLFIVLQSLVVLKVIVSVDFWAHESWQYFKFYILYRLGAHFFAEKANLCTRFLCHLKGLPRYKVLTIRATQWDPNCLRVARICMPASEANRAEKQGIPVVATVRIGVEWGLREVNYQSLREVWIAFRGEPELPIILGQ